MLPRPMQPAADLRGNGSGWLGISAITTLADASTAAAVSLDSTLLQAIRRASWLKSLEGVILPDWAPSAVLGVASVSLLALLAG